MLTCLVSFTSIFINVSPSTNIFLLVCYLCKWNFGKFGKFGELDKSWCSCECEFGKNMLDHLGPTKYVFCVIHDLAYINSGNFLMGSRLMGSFS